MLGFFSAARQGRMSSERTKAVRYLMSFITSVLLRFEHKIYCTYHADAGVEVVHGEGAFHVVDGEGDENGEGDDLLKNFELWEGEGGVAEAVGRDLEEVFEEGDRPTHDDGDEEGFGFEISQVGIPREGHEDV